MCLFIRWLKIRIDECEEWLKTMKENHNHFTYNEYHANTILNNPVNMLEKIAD